MHDLRGDENHLIIGRIHRNGVEYSQSGSWEFLLCKDHESRLSAADTYGVDFCRRARALVANQSENVEVTNPTPQLLLRFALSVVWRHVHSKSGRAIELSLGTHEKSVRDAIFEHIQSDYQLILNSSYHSIGGEAVDIASMPARGRLSGRNAWRFTLARVDFSVAVSRERWGPPFAQLLASVSDPAVVLAMPLLESAKLPGHQSIFERMRNPTLSPRR